MERTRRLAAGALALLGAILWIAVPAAADPVRARILQGLEIRDRSDATEVHVRFRVPVRYLRHSPARAGSSLQIQIEPLTLDRADRAAASLREALRPPTALDIPLVEVTYEGDDRDVRELDVTFTHRVGFRVRQGQDFRSLVLTLAKPSESLALQLYASPAYLEPPAVDPRHVPVGRRLYTVAFTKQGEGWRRVRLGFFRTRGAAERARRDVLDDFPDAFIVTVPRAEEGLAAKNALAPRKPMDPADPTSAAPRLAGPAKPPTAGPILPGRTGPAPPSPRTTPDPDATPAAALMKKGRAALTGGEPDRAIAAFGEVLNLPENEHTRDAQELLGVARERKGQLAHAKAEYETYLERYPDGDDAERVRQRLESLLTARSERREPLREARDDDRDLDWNVFGSLGVSYRRAVAENDLADKLVGDSSLLTDAFVRADLRTNRLDVRSEASGTYLFDFTRDGDDAFRANTLFAEIDDRQSPFSGSFGRQSGNSGGVIGRFDGLRGNVRLSDHWAVSSVAGFPVDPFITNGIDTDRTFYGVSLDSTELLPGLDTQIYAIQQWWSGTTDRTAVGGEFRYARDRLFLAGLVDVDVHFGALNAALVTGNWLASEDTTYNLFIDHRKLPSLATSNALLGQPEDSLGELERRFSDGEIEDLAEDRTAHSSLGSVGVTHRLTDRHQVSGDLSVSHLSDTPASGEVEGFEGTGLSYSAFVRLVTTGVIRDGDVGSLGMRYTYGDVQLVSLHGNLRYPVTRRIRLTPLVTVTYRRPEDGDDVLSLVPALRLDYRLGPYTLDAEVGYRWENGERFPGAGDESGYRVFLGVRYDFSL